MIRLIFSAALIVAFIGGAQTQGSGTPEDQRACSASVKRFCASATQGGDMAILGCLQQNRTRISSACQRVLIKYGQ